MRLLTVSWEQPSNPLGGKAHVSDTTEIPCRMTLCGVAIPRDGYLRYAMDLPEHEVCVWCLRKLKRGAEAMAEKEGE